MESDDKKVLIDEAKSRGGDFRGNLLEIHRLAGLSLMTEEADEENPVVKAVKDKLSAAGQWAAGKMAGAGEYLTKKGTMKGGDDSVLGVDKKAGLTRTQRTGAAVIGAPALAAGLGAVGLAKKMRSQRKAG